MIFFVMLWVSNLKNIPDNMQTFKLMAREVMIGFTRPSSGLIENLTVLSLPYWEMVYLLGIALSGLNKMDFYHLAFLVFFVLYLLKPDMKFKTTQWVLIYGFVFIILKYTYTLLEMQFKFSDKTIKILDIIGIGSEMSNETTYKLF